MADSEVTQEDMDMEDAIAKAKKEKEEDYLGDTIAHAKKELGEVAEEGKTLAKEGVELGKQAYHSTKQFINEKIEENKVRAKENRAEKLAKLRERAAELRAENEVRQLQGQVRSMGGASPFQQTVHGRQEETPFYMRGSDESMISKGLAGGNSYQRKEQRSALADIMFGRAQEPKTRQKTVIINGKTYVSNEPIKQRESRTMLQEAMIGGNPSESSSLISKALQGRPSGSPTSGRSSSPLAKAMFGKKRGGFKS